MNRAELKHLLPSIKGVLGINARNLDLIYTHNRRNCFPNVDDKLRCKELLKSAGIPTPTTYHIVSGRESLLQWESALKDMDCFVIKPNCGYGGNGIKLITRSESEYLTSGEEWTAEDIAFHLMQILNGAFSLDNATDTCYFEQTVVNDIGLEPLIPPGVEGVGDIRIIYKLESPLMAMLRLPTRESNGKANLHQGGIGVGIDLLSGLTLNGVHHNNVIRAHPDSSAPLAGQRIPFFADMLEIGSAISELVGLGYIGVDFVCDAHQGPLVLEVNARPGLNIQLANGSGLRSRL
ncbi:MAG: sugar-transfer associated ATP-grasp domain-containing protein [candidate division Zixibacteria bacterium]|nr:sugar-transfer associated ATP-grasp domain-containing protein [candidate division Zixibacteria bacterium]